MKIKAISYIGSYLILLLASCKKDEPFQPSLPTIQITAEGGGSTDALLRVKLTDSADPRGVAVVRDGQRVMTLGLTRSDSLIIDEGLAPSHTYTYTAVRLQDTTSIDVSAPLQVTTLDTTSHNWVFGQPQLFGDGSTSILYDCQIINDTLAYAVGEMYLRDSSGHLDQTPYNLAKWDGSNWHITRLYYNYQGQQLSEPLLTVYALSENNIWVAGTQPRHWNGSTWEQFGISSSTFDGRASRIWAYSSSSAYMVGTNGAIAFYNDTWQRVESGTTETINDVWGGSNPLLGENVVMMAVGWHATPGETKLLVVRGAPRQVDTLAWAYPLEPRWSVWFDSRSRIYTCGGGVFVSSNNGWRYLSELPLIYTNSVRGNGPNDIMVAGEFGFLGHFNGSTWHAYSEVALSGGSYQSVAIKGNLVVAVGWSGSRAVAVVGHR